MQMKNPHPFFFKTANGTDFESSLILLIISQPVFQYIPTVQYLYVGKLVLWTWRDIYWGFCVGILITVMETGRLNWKSLFLDLAQSHYLCNFG